MGSELDNIFNTFIDNLQLVVSKLSDEDSPRPKSPDFSLQEFWPKLGAAFDCMSTEAAKLALWFSKPPLPKPGECWSLMGSSETATIALVSAFYGLPKEEGLLLRKVTRQAVIQAVQGIHGLAKQIKQDRYNSSQSQLHSTGNVWERCDAFKTLPRDNRDALIDALRDEEGLVADAAEELEELLASNGQMADGWDDLNEPHEAPPIHGDHVDNTWTARDREIHPPSAGLIKAARSCLKKVTASVKANGRWDRETYVEQLDVIGDVAHHVSPTVDDLVTCLYPPMRNELVRQNANKSAEILLNLLERAKNSHVTQDSDGQWLTFLDQAVRHNLDRITQLTAAEQTETSTQPNDPS